jgi:two-component system, chemotaxis family, sensor kinase CheA
VTMSGLDSLRATFFEECEDLLARMAEDLARMSEAVENTEMETIHGVFRAVHSIKGGAAAFGLSALVNFAHVYESVLDLMRSGKLIASVSAMHTLLRAYDLLCDLVSAARDGGDAPEHTDQLLLELDLLSDGQGAPIDEGQGFDFSPVALDIFAASQDQVQLPADETKDGFVITFKPGGSFFAKGHEPVALLRALGRLGAVRIATELGNVALLSEFDPARPSLGWTVELQTASSFDDVDAVFEFVGDLAQVCIVPLDAQTSAVRPLLLAPPASPVPLDPVPLVDALGQILTRDDGAPAVKRVASPASGPVSSAVPATIRVNLDRVDRLINQIGELVITEAILSQAIDNAHLRDDGDIASSLEGIKQLAASIQESVMAIRAQPLKSVFQRMERITREAADATGKQVRLVATGEGTEVDKTVIERLVDPLTHMIRNSVDHGIESVEGRRAAGKCIEGQITLSAAHRSGRVIIEVRDDGGGINRPRVRELAEQKGLVPAGVQLTPADVDNLLFLPGFSSKDEVSALSGRGVGLDVVRREIQALGGRVSIQSIPGQGTTFTIALPLTLAVLEGMLIGVGDQTMVLPLSTIIETLRPTDSQIHRLGPAGRVIINRGETIPIIDLAAGFGFACRTGREGRVLILVECDSGRRAALAVDHIHDQRQVVIKSLEDNFGSVPGISAATILGDGRIALIVDPEEVLGRFAADSLSYTLAANG